MVKQDLVQKGRRLAKARERMAETTTDMLVSEAVRQRKDPLNLLGETGRARVLALGDVAADKTREAIRNRIKYDPDVRDRALALGVE